MKERIDEFKQRIEVDGREFCLSLFENATTRLMAHKYLYYVTNNPWAKDYAYDLEEKGWHCMGQALGLLNEHEVSPCVDWDEKHPFAQKGIELAKKWTK